MLISYYYFKEGLFSQFFNSLSISIYVVVFLDVVWRWDNTKKKISDLFEIGMPFFVPRMTEQALQEATLAAIFPKDAGETVAQDTEIRKYATDAINSFKKSLSGCQFYESVHYAFDVRMEKVVVVDVTCTEYVRRFGKEQFDIHHENDEGVNVENIRLYFGHTELSMNKDFTIEKTVDEKDRVLNENSTGWKVRFNENKDWREEVLTVKYSMHYDDHDHWTEINWAAKHPICKMTATVICRNGLFLQEYNSITDKNHKIMIKPNNTWDRVDISSEWLMPGQGYTLVISNQKRTVGLISGVEAGTEKTS